MAASRWHDVNRLLHSLVILRSDLRERRTLTHLLRSARALVSAPRALLRVTDPATGSGRVRAELGFPRGVRNPVSDARELASAALRHRKPLLVFRPVEEKLAQELTLLGGDACLSVPILPGGEPWGVLQLLRNEPFGADDAILVWFYVMVLEETLADSPRPLRFVPGFADPNGHTGLGRMGEFEQRLDEEMERSLWSGRPVSVARVTWQPSAAEVSGEELLLRVTRVCRRSVRPGAPFSTRGEGELLILLPGIGPIEALSLCRILRRNLIQSRSLGEESEALAAVAVSAATFPRDGISRPALLAALSEPKQGGQHGPPA